MPTTTEPVWRTALAVNIVGLFGGLPLSEPCTAMNDCFDPTMAPEGKPVIVVRYESPWELWNDVEGDAYRAGKKEIEPDSGAIMKNIFRRLEMKLPGLRNFHICGQWLFPGGGQVGNTVDEQAG